MVDDQRKEEGRMGIMMTRRMGEKRTKKLERGKVPDVA